MRRKRLNQIALTGGALLVVGALLAAVGFGASQVVSSSDAAQEADPTPVRVMTVTREDHYEVRRTFLGRVEARQASELSFELGGKIASVEFDEGDVVAEGTLVARLDTARLEARRAELVASLGEAQADLELARLTLKRTSRASEGRAANAQELDRAIKAVDASEARLARTQASIDSIEVDLAKSAIEAPFDAVVSRRQVDPGEVIAAGAPVLTLLERSSPEARIGLAGPATEAIAAGDRVMVSIRDQEIEGEVIALLPVRRSGLRTVEARIVLDAKLDGIRAGDIAELELPRRVESDGFWAPSVALTQSVRGLWALYVAEPADKGDGHVLRRREVEVLHAEDDRVFLRGPVASDELVVIAGRQRLVPGIRVRPEMGAGGGE